MMRRLWICLIGLLAPLSVNAVSALVSHATFFQNQNVKTNSLRPILEIYWQIDQNTVYFNEDANKQWGAAIQTDITLSTDTGIVAQNHYILTTVPAQSKEHARWQNIIDIQRFELPAGKIHIKLQLTDISNASNQFTYVDSLVLPAAAPAPFYSTIQLLDTAVISANEKDAFYKNGKVQVPLSTNFLDDHRDILLYYAELYQTRSVTPSDTLIQRIFISKKPLDHPVAGLQRTDTIKRKAVWPLTGDMNITMLPSGNYYLNAVLEDQARTRLASSSTFFQRINTVPRVAKDTVRDTSIQKIELFDLSETFVGKYTVAQLRAILKMLQPIATPMEHETIQGFLKKPDETFMRYFVYNFWTARDNSNPKKEWDKYTALVREVNKFFGSSAVPGYETDRGQIYLRYGKPNERIVVNNETGALPYEVWVYNATEKQGSPGTFLFYKPGYMIADFKLLHSTVNGEIRNTAWREFLYMAGGQATATSNFRAEQYLK
jgi:GWxTD domain-containing protein